MLVVLAFFGKPGGHEILVDTHHHKRSHAESEARQGTFEPLCLMEHSFVSPCISASVAVGKIITFSSKDLLEDLVVSPLLQGVRSALHPRLGQKRIIHRERPFLAMSRVQQHPLQAPETVHVLVWQGAQPARKRVRASFLWPDLQLAAAKLCPRLLASLPPGPAYEKVHSHGARDEMQLWIGRAAAPLRADSVQDGLVVLPALRRPDAMQFAQVRPQLPRRAVRPLRETHHRPLLLRKTHCLAQVPRACSAAVSHGSCTVDGLFPMRRGLRRLAGLREPQVHRTVSFQDAQRPQVSAVTSPADPLSVRKAQAGPARFPTDVLLGPCGDLRRDMWQEARLRPHVLLAVP
ncbi:hypothetical protein KL909_004943 [Ogataea angusta]|nr:hypothetical protein KL909_004943 [Ogataea angusta]